MKKIIFNTLLWTVSGFLFAQLAFADWSADIHADREDNHPLVKIGIGDEMNKIVNAPEPPDFKCFMQIIDPEMNAEYYKTFIYPKGKLEYHWIIAINPHGNSGPITTSATVSWDTSKLGPGKFLLIEGAEPDGNVIVPDMKSQNTFDSSTDKNKFLLYSIINTPGLSDLIGTLRILSGFNVDNPVFFIDLDEDGKTELSDSVYLIKHLAKNP